MKRPTILAAFSDEETDAAHALLASQVVFMMGRKLEEGDWTTVYCGAKGIPDTGWSNLNIDVIHEGLGVEHKMLCKRSRNDLKEFCGTTLMHPSATRSIRVPEPADTPPETAMRDVLEQYAELIEARRQQVAETSPDGEADLRTGWLLWQTSLRQFLYFEEEVLIPDPEEYYAEWNVRESSGARKQSTSLWIFERETERKRYSVTTSAGPKIQPYFDVPGPDHPHLYEFIVQGESLSSGKVRIWVSERTERELERLLGRFDPTTIQTAIDQLAPPDEAQQVGEVAATRLAVELVIEQASYQRLQSLFPDSVSDEHMMTLFAEQLGER